MLQKRWLRLLFSSLSALAFFALTPQEAKASHYRGGTLTYKIISGRTVEFKLETYWRINASNYAGSLPVYRKSDNRRLGNASRTAFGRPVRKGDAHVVWETFRYTFPSSPNDFYARWTSCCWISGARGPAGSSWDLRVEVRFGARANSDPEINSPTYFEHCPGRDFITNVNARDPDGDPITYDLFFKPSGMTIDTTGKITFKHTSFRAGQKYVFSIRVRDNRGGTSYRDYMMEVKSRCSNRPPTIRLSVTSVTTQPGKQVCTRVTGSDPDGHNLTFFASPTKTGVTLNPTNALSANRPSNYSFTYCWTPTSADGGAPHGILFTVFDSGSPKLQAQATFRVTVSKESPPTITLSPSGTTKTVDENKTLSFTATAADPDGNGISSFTSTGRPSFCTATLAGTRWSVVCRPNYTHGTRTYNLTFAARDRDPSPKTTTVVVRVTVRDVNRPPTARLSTQGLSEGRENNVKVTGSDPDGDRITYSMTGLPSGARINSTTGEITWTPTQRDVGTHTAVITVTDAKGAKVTIRVTFVVSNVNDRPTITSRPPTTSTEDRTLTYTPTATDPDPGDRGKLNWKFVGTVPSGAKIDPKTGRVTWTPGDADVAAGRRTFTI